jgi:hypothetical protein
MIVKPVRLMKGVSLPLLVMLAAVPGLAQPQRPNHAVATEQEKLRLQIAAMEGVLATAVHEIHSQQLEKMAPGLLQFDGAIRARGFQLDGYGIFFDVDLPPLPRTVAWSLRLLESPVRLDFELAQLRRQVQAVADPRLRQEFEQTLRTIQRKVSVSSVTSVGGQTGEAPARTEGAMVQASRGGEPDAQPQPPRPDPFATYAAELGEALADLMVQYGGTIALKPDEWLTIAAREQSRLLPGGPVQTALTLRIKGGDLAAFKTGRLNAEEARKKVEIKEF